MIERTGYRGYIASRKVAGSVIPQRVQNLVVRDFCNSRNITFKLSAVEYIMPECYMILEEVLRELPSLEGIVIYSVFMLPQDKTRRMDIYRRVLDAGCELHAALESMSIRTEEDIPTLEDVLQVQAIVSKIDFGKA